MNYKKPWHLNDSYNSITKRMVCYKGSCINCDGHYNSILYRNVGTIAWILYGIRGIFEYHRVLCRYYWII